MKIKIGKAKVRDELKWFLTVTHNGRALTDQEVAIGSGGLTTIKVRELSKFTNWSEVPIGEAK
jgi:hypothetical protein